MIGPDEWADYGEETTPPTGTGQLTTLDWVMLVAASFMLAVILAQMPWGEIG
jgi:hypothetical protein